MIYTSYFAGIRKFKLPMDKVISICLYPPNWYSGKKYSKLAPTQEILSLYKLNKITIQDYYNLYTSQILNKFDVHKMYNFLDNYILLCYEKSDDFCHRHIVSQWFRDNGYQCEEIKEIFKGE